MLRKLTAIGLALGFSASAAMAAEHDIYIVNGAFFPEVSFVSPGTVVRFHNENGTPHRVFNDEFGFVSDMITHEGNWAMTVQADTNLRLFARSFADGSQATVGQDGKTAEDSASINSNGQRLEGLMSFGSPD